MPSSFSTFQVFQAFPIIAQVSNLVPVLNTRESSRCEYRILFPVASSLITIVLPYQGLNIASSITQEKGAGIGSQTFASISSH